MSTTLCPLIPVFNGSFLLSLSKMSFNDSSDSEWMIENDIVGVCTSMILGPALVAGGIEVAIEAVGREAGVGVCETMSRAPDSVSLLASVRLYIRYPVGVLRHPHDDRKQCSSRDLRTESWVHAPHPREHPPFTQRGSAGTVGVMVSLLGESRLRDKRRCAPGDAGEGSLLSL